MTESQLSISTWQDATFGPASDASIAARALVEMAKLVTACVNGEPAPRIGEEIADVVIVLARLGRSVEVDALAMIDGWWPPVWSRVSKRPLWSNVAQTVVTLGRAMATLESPGPARRRNFGAVVAAIGYVAASVGCDLPAAIDAKMAINRTRRWTLDGHGHGHGSHVREVTP